MKSAELLRLLTILETSNVRFISGKYFQNDVEIKNIDAYIKKVCLNDSQLGMVLKVNDINEVKNQLKIDSDEELWPDMPIIKKAKELGPITKDMEEANNAPFDLDDKQLLILNILLFHPDEEVMFITTGVGGSGKSTFLNIIKQIYSNNFSAIPLSELTGFMVADGVKSRLICSDELGKGDLDTKILKTMISKQHLNVNPKYEKPFRALCQSSLFYCCNKAPRIDVSDTGILRRIVFYERNTKIQNPNTSLNHKVYTNEELLWFVRRALAYDRIHSFWRDVFKIETYKYLMKDNSVYVCWDFAVYNEYKDACSKKGLKAYSEPNWKDIRELFKEWMKEIKNEQSVGS